MDLLCRSHELERALRLTQGATSAQMDLKTGVGMAALLTCEGDILTITCTDLTVAIRTTVEAAVRRPGRACILQSLAQRIAGTLPEPTVRLATREHALTITSGNMRAQLFGDRPQDFPPVDLERPPGVIGANVSARAFAGAVANAAIGAQQELDPSRHSSNARLDLCTDELRVTTNSGFKATMVTVPIEREDARRNASAIIPVKSLMKAQSVALTETDHIWVGIDETRNRMHLESARSSMSAMLNTGMTRLPDPETPETEDCPTVLKIPTGRFRQAMNASEAFVKEGAEDTQFQAAVNRRAGPLVTMKVRDDMVGEVRDAITPSEAWGPDASVSVDTVLLRQIARQAGEGEITITLRGPNVMVVLETANDRMSVTHMVAPTTR